MNSETNTYNVVVEINKDQFSIQTHVLLFIKFYCKIRDSQYIFIESSPNSHIFIPLKNFQLNKVTSNIDFNNKLCELPCFIDTTGIIHSGLCNVVRKVISKCQNFIQLLGTTGSCLKACSEVSYWTKLIEVEFPDSIMNLVSNINSTIKLDDEKCYNALKTFEIHLNLPPVVTNISKLLHKNIKISNSNFCSSILNVRYAEGLQFLLTDLLLFCYVSIFLTLDSNTLDYIENNCPNICRWYKTVIENNTTLLGAALNCNYKVFHLKGHCNDEYIIGDTIKIKSNSERKSLLIRRASQIPKDIKDIILSFEICDYKLNDNLYDSFELIFNEISSSIFIDDSFPVKRRQKKLQQLQNMAASVLCLSPQDNQAIVDFCCGSGHLGLILANLLPKCNIILIENKEESLQRAFVQAKKFDLKNVTFIRSNIGHFKAPFEIGTCLHGCGFVTDLVLDKCYEAKASYVVSPCCYGAAKNTQDIAYPRSHYYRRIPNANISFPYILEAADNPITNVQINLLHPITKKSDNINIKNNPVEMKPLLSPQVSGRLFDDKELVLTDAGSFKNEIKESNGTNITQNLMNDALTNEIIERVETDIVQNLISDALSIFFDINWNISNIPENHLNSSTSMYEEKDSVAIETSLTKRCMHIVDMDRQMYARQLGYRVNIRTMSPATCTPKNNILIGRL